MVRFFEAAVTWGATDLLADVPLLPGRLFARIAGYPIQEGYGDARYLQALPGLLRQEQFRSGELKAVVLTATDAENIPYWMFAKAKGFVVFTRAWGVADNHWIWEHVLEIEDHRPQVEVVGERLRSTLEGQWIRPDVVLCEAYRVGIDGDVVELTDEAMVWTGASGDEQLVLVPDGELSGAAVEQCSSYLDEDDRWRGELVDQRSRGIGHPHTTAALERSNGSAALVDRGAQAGAVPQPARPHLQCAGWRRGECARGAIGRLTDRGKGHGDVPLS